MIIIIAVFALILFGGRNGWNMVISIMAILAMLAVFFASILFEDNENNKPEGTSRKNCITTFNGLPKNTKFIIVDSNHPDAGKVLEKNCFGSIDSVLSNGMPGRYRGEIDEYTEVIKIY